VALNASSGRTHVETQCGRRNITESAFLPTCHGTSDPDGLHLARALHELMPLRPMLFATTSMIDLSADAVAEAGITEILRRPLVSTELAAALARILRSPGALRT
jgi:CheY-like chemotaxis protein